ncbi:MAG TPA: pantoate--beta-alanine ligase [Bacteriovoracaceae bacterium]|nr:pantoate--beta-alanine ligase [Bacteriovoracaceae bacterium]
MVTLITDAAELRRLRSLETKPVAFVPTMGNLHAGHLSLLEEALRDFEIVYFSIFVNPKQFGPQEDFGKYPRTLEADVQLLSDLLKAHPAKKVILFSPKSPDEIFPESDDQRVDVTGISEVLEGKLRPGHFSGVATVVLRLFELVRPVRAYFGLKDYQQYLVIQRMVRDLAWPIEIKGLPIIREESGLALSSRNQYLTPEQKTGALVLYRTLTKLRETIQQENGPAKARLLIETALQDKNWNYLELRDSSSFESDVSRSKNITLLGVYQLGATRLLDNVQVEIE